MVKKTHKTEENPAIYGAERKTDASDSSALPRPIQDEKSDAFVFRLREVIGDEAISAFARRCNVGKGGIGEGTLRNILGGAWPRTDNLVAIADAGGVTVDWLSTGRLPKFRTDLKNTEPAPEPLKPAQLRMALMLAEESACVQPLTSEQRADMVLAFYHRLTKGNTT